MKSSFPLFIFAAFYAAQVASSMKGDVYTYNLWMSFNKKNLSKIDKLITINIDHINVEEAAAFYDAFLNIDPSKNI